MGRALRILTTLSTTTPNGVVHSGTGTGTGTGPTLWVCEDAHAHELARALMQTLAALGDALALTATTSAVNGADASTSDSTGTTVTATTATIQSPPPQSPSPLTTLRYHLSELTSYTNHHKDKGLDQGLFHHQHQDQGLTLPVTELAPVPRRFCGLPTGRGKEMVTILKVRRCWDMLG